MVEMTANQMNRGFDHMPVIVLPREDGRKADKPGAEAHATANYTITDFGTTPSKA